MLSAHYQWLASQIGRHSEIQKKKNMRQYYLQLINQHLSNNLIKYLGLYITLIYLD